MEMGKKLLAAGQLADALSHFHAAVGECQRHANNTKRMPGFSQKVSSKVTVSLAFYR